MRSSSKTYTITEYGGFTRGELPINGYIPLKHTTFDALESFILANYQGSGTDAVELLSLTFRRGIGKIITARNYVGLITMKDGTVIEILPKIYGGISELDTKRIFLEMLKTLKDASFKEFSVSSLKSDRLNLFEIFISMFVTEASLLIKQGLKSTYLPIEANERFFKGKLNVSQDIKHNYVNREHFYVAYDEWSINRPENRILKSTLFFLHKISTDSRNRSNISRILNLLEHVNSSTDYEADFSKCSSDRSMSRYKKTLSWCKVFLRGNSFTAFTGSEVAVALLFPMERIFESYISTKLRRYVTSEFEFRTQDNQYSLFDSPSSAFKLHPDIVIMKVDETVVMDTKWKILSANAHNYGISQSDMYQMYAYSKKYDAKKIVLIYPQSEDLGNADISFSSEDGVNVEISFIDLMNPEKSLSALF